MSPGVKAADAFIGIGSNLEGPAERVQRAFAALAGLPETALTGRSPLYGSTPMGPADQPDFVNAVARLTTGLPPHDLLDQLQRVEHEAGRVRTGERWGPRTLDLDLLVYGERELRDERLTVPHPGIGERAFVAVPLADLQPDLVIPGLGRVGSLVQRVDRSGLWPTAPKPRS